jgi:hypothetical protein
VTDNRLANVDALNSSIGKSEEFSIPNSDVVLRLRPMDLGQCVRFAHQARPMFAAMVVRGLTEPTEYMGAVLLAAAEAPNAFLDCLAIATGEKRKVVATFPPAVAITLVMRLIALNADFLVSSLDAFTSLVDRARATSPVAVTENIDG